MNAPAASGAPGPTPPRAATNPSAPAVYAGFWRRFAAWVIDYIALLAAAVVLRLFLPSGEANVGAFFLLVWLVYKVGMESSSMQATVGKLALGIKVTDSDGERIGIGRAVARFFALFLSFLTLYIGFVMAGFTRRRQALHDLIADTLVVRKELAPSDVANAGDAPRVSGWAVVGLLLLAIVPISGMVAAIAIPAYQDYTIRAQVVEGMNLTRGHTVAVQAMLESGKASLNDIDSITMFEDLPSSGHYVEAIEIDSGAVIIKYGSRAARAISGRTLAFVPAIAEGNRVAWVCGYATPRAGYEVMFDGHEAFTDVPQKYLPSTCRGR